METPQLSALQKAKQKYYAKKRETIAEAKAQQRIDKLNSLTLIELDQLKQKQKDYINKKKETMTDEEKEQKKQKQSEYKSKFIEKKEQETKIKKIAYAEKAREKYEQDPLMFNNPDELVHKPKQIRLIGKKSITNKIPEPIAEPIPEPIIENIIINIVQEIPKFKRSIKLKSKTKIEIPKYKYYDFDLDEDVEFEEMTDEELFSPSFDEAHAQKKREYKLQMAKYRQYDQQKKIYELRQQIEKEEQENLE